jgi:hypothetical protein
MKPRLEQNSVTELNESLPIKDATNAPLTRMERLVAKCWEDELKVTGIGLEDDFFSLGGDSRHALQMIFRVQEQLPALLPLGALFFHDPTLKGFAAQLSELFQIEEQQ